MSIRRLLVVAHKEFCHITRDLRLLFLVTVAPAFLLVTLSYVFALDVGRIDLAVNDLDQTALSRDLVSHITADGDFRVVTRLERVEDVERLFTRAVADMVLIIPRGFAREALQGEPAQIQCVVDGVDAIGASQSLGLLESRVQALMLQLHSTRMERTAQSWAGLADEPLSDGVDGIAIGRVVIKERAWYNEALKSLISMVPGLMAVILCMPALAFALALAREKEMGSFESLIVTPVRGFEYLIGKLLAYEAGGIASGVFALLVATFWFQVPFRGTISDFLLLTADYMLASTGISLVVASLVRNQQTAMFLILMIFFVPSFFLAGLIRPVAEEPIARAVALALPSTHFISICRSLFLKGLRLSALKAPALAMLGIGLGCQAISLFLFKKKLT